MGAIIYETTNLYNEKHGILPYKYIGSDQHNKLNYFGSSKSLIKDIKVLGKENFSKRIIYEFDEIENIKLRELESNLQKELDVASNPIYYNRTNSSHKGYVETEEEKNARMKKAQIKFRIWYDNLSVGEKGNYCKNIIEKAKFNSQLKKGKTYEEIYGIEKAKIKKDMCRGKNNGMARQILDIATGKIFDTMKDALQYYGIKKYDTLRLHCLKGEYVRYYNKDDENN
jgi:hypothetical protein